MLPNLSILTKSIPSIGEGCRIIFARDINITQIISRDISTDKSPADCIGMDGDLFIVWYGGLSVV